MFIESHHCFKPTFLLNNINEEVRRNAVFYTSAKRADVVTRRRQLITRVSRKNGNRNIRWRGIVGVGVWRKTIPQWKCRRQNEEVTSAVPWKWKWQISALLMTWDSHYFTGYFPVSHSRMDNIVLFYIRDLCDCGIIVQCNAVAPWKCRKRANR